MTDAAFKATFSDFRLVKGRKVAQVVLECPIESADAALAALGGLPKPDAEVWVGVARLDAKAASDAPNPGKEHRKFTDLPYPQQAWILSEDPRFEKFAHEKMAQNPGGWAGVNDPADFIRKWCGVASRADLTTNLPGQRHFRELMDTFTAWKAIG